MYPSTSVFIAVGQLAIAILVMFSYPLQIHPCRNCLDKIFHLGSKVTKSTLTDDDDDDVSVVDEHGTGDMSTFKHVVLTLAITVGGFAIAYFVDDLQTGESPRPTVVWMGLTQPPGSPLLRWFHRIDDGFVYPTWSVILEADKGRSGNGEVVESVRARPCDIRNASIRVLVRNSRSDSSLWLTEVSPQPELQHLQGCPSFEESLRIFRVESIDCFTPVTIFHIHIILFVQTGRWAPISGGPPRSRFLTGSHSNTVGCRNPD